MRCLQRVVSGPSPLPSSAQIHPDWRVTVRRNSAPAKKCAPIADAVSPRSTLCRHRMAYTSWLTSTCYPRRFMTQGVPSGACGVGRVAK